MDQGNALRHVEITSARMPADVSTLLVELGRSLKAWQFYPGDHPARQELLERSLRAWQGELQRGGPLDLEIRRGTFWLADSQASVGQGHLDDLARTFVVRGVRRLYFGPGLDAGSFGAFLDVLAMDPDALRESGGFERQLYSEPRPGILVNEVDYGALGAPRTEEVQDTDESAEEDPRFLDAAFDASGQTGSALPPGLERELPGLQGALAPDPEPPDQQGMLTGLLEQLGECDDDVRYRELASEAVTLASSLMEEEVPEAGFQALCVFAEHAGDDAKRGFSQREAAAGSVDRLANGATLELLIDHACSPDAEASLSAAEVLLLLGERMGHALLERLDDEADARRRARLTGVLITMGEDAAPALDEALAELGSRRQRAAVRLAGETQNPRFVPRLGRAFAEGDRELCRDAAKALVRIGDVAALEVLAEALNSPEPERVALAAYSLGTTGRALCVAPLVGALGRALDRGQLDLAREVARALGRLGRAEATEALAGILKRGGWLQRRRWREVKHSAVAALAHLPGDEAQHALERVADVRDARLREEARAALRRRRQLPDPA